MILVNFSHPLTEEQLAAMEQLAGRPVERVVAAPAQFDAGKPFAEQARALVEGVGLSPEEWQTAPLVVNLPGHSAIAALVLAEIHGRRGHFPSVLRLRPVAGAAVAVFEVAEIVNLQAAREAARELRG